MAGPTRWSASSATSSRRWLADTREQAVDASELVFVDYEVLTPVVDPATAADNETLVHERAGTNIVMQIPTTW